MPDPRMLENLHGYYLVKTNAIYKLIGHSDFGPQVDRLCRDICLGLWQGQTLTADHLKAYNALYSKGQKTPSTLYWELVSAAGSFPVLGVPDFFRVLVLTRKPAAEELLSFLRDLTRRLSDPDLSIPTETQFIQEMGRLLTGVLNSDDPLGFTALRGPDKRAGGSAAAQGKPGAAPAGAAAPQDPPEDLDKLLEELDSLVGLTQIKKDVRSLINLIKIRKLRQAEELKVPELSLHMVFTGNPGTGKTTVARLLARLYRSIGVLSTGNLLEVDRAGLVAGYVGQTALKTLEAVKKARGGILFVDEAYSLVPDGSGTNDFGQEAISTILKAMEDMREELVVIVAGYPEPMERFIESNPGLESRFGKYFHFEDYNGAELMDIFRLQCRKNQYVPDEETEKFCIDMFNEMYENRDENFGNARDVRNIFERAVTNQANRLAAMEKPTKDDLMKLIKDDIVGPKDEETEKKEEPEEKKDEETSE